jgi:hypothetical protein
MEVTDLIQILDETFPKEDGPVFVVIASQIYELTSREVMKEPHVIVVSWDVARIVDFHHLAALAFIASAEPVLPIGEISLINIVPKSTQKRRNTTTKPPKYLDNKWLWRKGR